MTTNETASVSPHVLSDTLLIELQGTLEQRGINGNDSHVRGRKATGNKGGSFRSM